MNEQQFKLGDIARLKSGGPPMTVNYISDKRESVECVWFDDKEERQNSDFNPNTLQMHKPALDK